MKKSVKKKAPPPPPELLKDDNGNLIPCRTCQKPAVTKKFGYPECKECSEYVPF